MIDSIFILLDSQTIGDTNGFTDILWVCVKKTVFFNT